MRHPDDARLAPSILLRMAAVLLAGGLLGLNGETLRAENASFPAPPGTPVLEVWCDERLGPVVEALASDLRREGQLDVHLRQESTPAILARKGRSGESADLILVEGKEALTIGARKGWFTEKEMVTLASDRLALVTRRDASGADPVRFLGSLAEGRFVMPDPQTTSAGLHAESALKRTGLWEKIRKKVRPTAGGRAAVEEVASGRADAALVYATDAAARTDLVTLMVMPERSHLPILYIGAAFQDSPRKAGAVSFLLYLSRPDAGPVWLAHGFSPPPTDAP